MSIEDRLKAAKEKLVSEGVPQELMDNFLRVMKKDLEREQRMNDTFYIITRGYEGKALTSAQRKSSLFAEEPVVMGKILRRGSPPMRLTPAEYDANMTRLKQLEAAGSIKITPPGIRGASINQAILDEVSFSDEEKVTHAKALEQQRLMQEQQVLAALEADNKAKAEEELKAVEEAKTREVPVEVVVVPAEVPAPPPSAPKAAQPAVEPAAEASTEVVSAKHDKKSHGSKKGKG